MVASPKSAKQACPSLSIRILALSTEQVRWQSDDDRSKSYPLQVTVHHRLTVHIYQPTGNVFELRDIGRERKYHQHWKQNPTSSKRFASWWLSINSLMFPFFIHSDVIAKREMELSIVTPNKGSTFGWRRIFQVTTSLQNLWYGKNQLPGAS